MILPPGLPCAAGPTGRLHLHCRGPHRGRGSQRRACWSLGPNLYSPCNRARSVGLKRFVLTRLATMFGVLMVTLLLTIVLVGSNMDAILKQGIVFQVRSELVSDGSAAAFETAEEFEAFVQGRVDARAEALGLDEPWYSPQRVGLAMYRILVLDFGHATFLTSDTGSSHVGEIIFEKLPRTVLLFTTATVLISIAGIFLGALSASRAGSAIDRMTSAFAVVSSSFPVWWVGMLMIFAFAFTYQVFPARATPDLPPGDPGYVAALLYHMALPLITIVLIGFGSWAYLVRNFMVGILQEDFVSAKRAAGISGRKIVYSHALRNAAPPVVTILALSLSGSLGGAIITEAVFDWPGMGRLYFEAITVLDLPVIIGATYVLTVFFLASIFAADLLYGYLDPRMRTGRGR
ncbi:ABC-type dipeptide/oligopeptide/nickel transport system, permease component [Cenarchaeum symbiosum A]|uniref:ABC-type dipeptide/oligopeptide/nickel transport system, permease component n=1 Tax=Cenarchaeum symbiosum (strain A) TaxID=414004 RepID=A0RX64_CENSY|nr:ABC-type dipeptide/oligopeptide/nickel transport system, permease component [Cenarchaeum symbiosum A]